MKRRTHILSLSTLVALLTVGAAVALAVPPGLRPADPIVCHGNRDIVLRGRSIETSGNGVQVQGNCNVEITDSHIVAGGVGVLVQGNGEVSIHDSHVEGQQAALVAEGNGEIRYRNTTLAGSTYTGGHGEIVGDDHAVHSSRGGTGIRDALQGLAGIKIENGGIRIQDGKDSVTIGSDGIVVDDGTDTVRVRPGVDGLRVETDDVALVLDADVRVDGNLLRLGVGASVEISPTWRDAGHASYGRADTDRLLRELGASDQDGQLHLGLAGDVLFDLDSAEIRSVGAAELRKLAHVLRQRATGEIELVGHTDSLGGDEHNLELSRARAVAVMRWLHREEGIPAQLMVGRGMGAQKPIAYNTMPDGSDHPEGRAQNRRVEIFFATR